MCVDVVTWGFLLRPDRELRTTGQIRQGYGGRAALHAPPQAVTLRAFSP